MHVFANIVILLCVIVSAVIPSIFFVGAWRFAVRHRREPFARPYGMLLAGAGLLSVFANPFSNIPLAGAIDSYSMHISRRECIHKPVARLYSTYGAPDAVWTNDHGTFHLFRDTSPFFSMYPFDTIALTSNSTTIALWHDD